MHIEDDKLTIYPIGVEKVPSRKDWIENPDYDPKKPDPDHARILCKKEIEYKLIEMPIVI